MENFGSRVFSVNDYREWAASGQLVLSPQFQRRVVWTDTARSYLMDTIIRGKPIPKIFLRQRIDLASGQSIREVVDGQQRLRPPGVGDQRPCDQGFFFASCHRKSVEMW